MKRILPVLIVISVLMAVGVFFPTEKESSPFSPRFSKASSAEIPRGPLLSLPEKEALTVSVKKMTRFLATYAGTGKSLEDLIEDLKTNQQDPFIVRDANKYTGEMIILRTKNPYPGTRYFHAQYFTDENHVRFAQHMSFEIRPHAEAMDQAIAVIRDFFPQLGTPTEQSPDFIQWDLENGHVLWIKRLGPEDIEENPFNAYTPEDLGSLRIAVETRLEGH